MTRNSAALAVLAVLATTGTEGDGTDESQHAAHAMHDGRAGEVVKYVPESRHHKAVGSIVAEPTAAPCPVSLDGVDDQRDHRAVNHVHRELCALCHGAADDGGRGGAEDRLENEETLYGQLAFVEAQVAPVGRADEAGTV